MSRKTRFLLIIYFIVLGIVLFNTTDLSKLTNNLEYIACGSATKIPKPYPQLTTVIYTLLITATPLVLIVMSIITLVKAITSGNIEEVSKAKSKLLKKIIITVIIFLVAGIVQFVLNKVTTTDDDRSTMLTCLKCFLYFDENSCPIVDYDADIVVTPHHRSYTNRAKPVPSDNNASKSNSSNSSSSSNSSPAYGSFSGEEIHSSAVFMVKWEAGLDSNGKPKYGNFGNCGVNNSNEKSITIGSASWMGPAAKELLLEIQKKYPDTFKKLDTGGVLANDLKNANWNSYCVERNSQKGNIIVNILTSDDGKKVQDEKIEANIRNYIKECEDYGMKDKRSMFIYFNVRHINGYNGTKPLLNNTGKPYEFIKMYNTLMSMDLYKYDIDGKYVKGWVNRWNDSKKYAEEHFK